MFDFKLLFKLLQYIKPYRYIFYTTIFISISFGFLSTLRPLLIQFTFDNYILKYDKIGLLNIISIIFIFLFFEAFLQFVFVYRSNYLGQKIIKDIRLALFSKIMSLKVSFFDKTPTGQLITRVVSDMEAVSSIFSQGLLVIFGDIFKMAIILLCMFISNWQLAIVSVLCLPILLYATSLFQKYMKLAFIDVRKYISQMNVFVHERLVGMNIIQVFGREKKELDAFKKINAHHRDANIKTVLYFSIFLPIVDVFSAISMGLVVWYGAIQILTSSDVSIGQIIAFILFINMLFRPLRSMADKFNILQMGIVAASRVFKILDQDNIDILELNHTQTTSKVIGGVLEFRHVNFSYNTGEKVLSDLSFILQHNETLAIIGPTGSGKTTIINLLMKWYDINKGDIYIGGNHISNISNYDLRKNIGIVLQDTFFLSDTLMNNIKFFNDISDDEVFNAVRDVGLINFIDKFPGQYNYHVGERGSKLSEGEKQLVSFLRVYLLNPAYIILDEATSSMDPLTEGLIQKSIKNITKKRTSIIIAHRLSTIKDADRIIVLNQGQIVESGSHKELLELNGEYSHYYQQQFISK
jgi:ATP-binding cassette subfamily B multidrug efflux pump